MLSRHLLHASLCLIAGVHAAGCYADSVKVPEPTLTTPGAFVAVPFVPTLPPLPTGSAGAAGQAGEATSPSGEGEGEGAGEGGAPGDAELYNMIRVLAVLDVTSDLAIFHLQYGMVDSLDAAREATKSRPSGPPPPVGITSLGRLESLDAVVVGFRSLTEEEQAVIR